MDYLLKLWDKVHIKEWLALPLPEYLRDPYIIALVIALVLVYSTTWWFTAKPYTRKRWG